MQTALFYLHLLLSVSSPVGQEVSPRVVSAERVLAMIADVPPTQRVQDEAKSGGWDHFPMARATADAISRFSPDERTAARLAVYSALEGGLKWDARGDGGKALGLLQLHGAPESIAFSPVYAIPRWLRLAAWSSEHCHDNSPRERLAALASGRCNRGRKLVHRREDIVDLVLGLRQPGAPPLPDVEEERATYADGAEGKE